MIPAPQDSTRDAPPIPTGPAPADTEPARQAAAPPRHCQRSADLAAHKPLVLQIARRIRARLPASVGIDELEQAGLLGLDEALSRFEAGRGSTFESYAARRIEGSMLDALRAMDTLSRGTRLRLRLMHAAVQRMEHRLGRAPRAKEVANELGWSLDELHTCMVEAGAAGARSGEFELENADDTSSLWAGQENSVDAIDERSDPFRALQQQQRHAALNAAFDALEEAERFVVEALYKHGASLKDVGETLGLSESRVSRLSAQIVAKLRVRLRDW
jgi:RNA polymerase sigma factor FliA